MLSSALFNNLTFLCTRMLCTKLHRCFISYLTEPARSDAQLAKTGKFGYRRNTSKN